MTVLIQNKAPPQTTLLMMAYFETGNVLDVSYCHQGGKVFAACYNTGISNNDLWDSRPSHFTPLSFCRAVWCAPDLIRWGTSYWAVLCSAGCSNLLQGKLLPSLFSPIFIHFLWARCVCTYYVACKSSLVFIIPPCSITFGSIIWMFNLRCSGFSASQYAHFGSLILQSFRF